MLKNIDMASEVLANVFEGEMPCELAGWLIKKEQIAKAQCAADLISQAQQKAESLLRLGHAQAQEDRQEGFRQGVYAGVAAALSPMRELLLQVHVLKAELRADAANRVRMAMEDLLGRAPALVAVLDTVLEAHLPQKPATLRLCIPCGADVCALEAHCAGQGVHTNIEVARTADVFSVAWEGHLWEVQFDSLCEPTRIGSPELKQALSEEDVLALCAQALSVEAERLLSRAGVTGKL